MCCFSSAANGVTGSRAFSWPRTPEEAKEISREQYQMLMLGLNPIKPKIREVHPRGVT
jgi:transposase